MGIVSSFDERSSCAIVVEGGDCPFTLKACGFCVDHGVGGSTQRGTWYRVVQCLLAGQWKCGIEQRPARLGAKTIEAPWAAWKLLLSGTRLCRRRAVKRRGHTRRVRP